MRVFTTKTKLLAFFLVFYCLSSRLISAQDLKVPVNYLNHLSTQNMEITKDYMSYSSAVAHGKSARKVENRRKEMITSTKTAISNISKMPPFEGDKSLRDSVVAFLKLSYNVLNEDYAKILDMEEVAEQSYDGMEAYLLAQDLANEKMNSASKRLGELEKSFAQSHHINIIESEDKLSKKVEKTNEVNVYYRPIYLIFFKSYKQEMYLLEALKKKDFNEIEQNKNTLKQFSEEGLEKLKEIKAYDGDHSLKMACQQALSFYKMESESKMSTITDFLLKEENFQKIKKAFDSKKQSERTKEDVDAYNKAVNDMNNGINEYNKANTFLNDNRDKAISGWNKGSQGFLDKHVPKY
jgi:hypothetical protein